VVKSQYVKNPRVENYDKKENFIKIGTNTLTKETNHISGERLRILVCK
jgi:hypothetical protein